MAGELSIVKTEIGLRYRACLSKTNIEWLEENKGSKQCEGLAS